MHIAIMFPFVIYKISGHSMEPALPAGSFVLVWKTKKIKKGDIVAFRHANQILIKRADTIEHEQIAVLGDNLNDSVDSRDFGLISKNQLIGKVILH